jgi:hypothetical protein
VMYMPSPAAYRRPRALAAAFQARADVAQSRL